MPKFEKLSKAEVEALRRRRNRTQDLSEYLEFLGSLKSGDWVRVTIGDGESQRAIKRRLTTASKQRGVAIKYKLGKSEQGQVLFEVK